MTKKNYCCYDCKHLKIPFDVDELGVPRPTNPYCKLGYDKNFKKYPNKWLAWINHAKYEMEICKHFKLKLSIRLHLRKIYNEANKMRLAEKDGIIIIPKRELDELKIRKAKRYAKKPLQVLAWQTDEELYIKTLEGVMKANKGDYIIQGVKGEYYPCKPDVFKETYEEVQVLEKLREVP